MNKPLSLEQLDHVCLIAERLVDCNNAVSENYHTNMLISKASKDYRCTDKLKTQLRWRRWLIGLYDKGAPSTVSVQYHFHEVTREHITISAEFTFSVSGATWKARILQSLSVDDKGCLLFGSNTAIDESEEDFATFDETTGQLLIPGLEIGGQIVYRNLLFLLTDAVNLLFRLESLEEG